MCLEVDLLSVYSSPSSSIWGEKTIDSSEGVQQGTQGVPSSSVCQSTTTAPFCRQSFCVMNLIDITMGGSTEEIVQNLEVIESLAEIGLCLNNHKVRNHQQQPSNVAWGLAG